MKALIVEDKAYIRKGLINLLENVEVDRYDKSGMIYLKNGQKIPVSSRKKEAFISTFLEYNRL